MGSKWEGHCPACGGTIPWHHAWCIEQACRTPKAESLAIGRAILAVLVAWLVVLLVVALLLALDYLWPSVELGRSVPCLSTVTQGW